jgi:hypothetical protein
MRASDNPTIQLIDTRTKAVIAEPHHSKSGWFSSSEKMNIDIHPSGITTLDAVVVSFILMDNDLRRSREQANMAAVASNTAAANMAASNAAAINLELVMSSTAVAYNMAACRAAPAGSC